MKSAGGVVQVVEHLPNVRQQCNTLKCQNKRAKNLNREFSHKKKKWTDKFKGIKINGDEDNLTEGKYLQFMQ
jgi:hypothetical protein